MMREKTLYLILPCIVLFAYSLFLLGFFPLKRVVPGFAKLENFTLANKIIAQPEQRYSKVVLVLIDALRSDFVFVRDHMPFVRGLQAAGLSRSFIVKAHPPTVTLPRLKALTSGSIPGFVDVVLNFDSQSLTEDNIISQSYNDGRKIVFYGDDTWIKLFPDHFVRSDGTTSFFVTDYTEVDDNVTRHISRELSTLDWDMMILHYLGLDHIGHTAGAYSPLVEPKLLEMDHIIQNIYTALKEENENSMILVCGDHGMLDQGSHGGASDNEILVPAVFISHTLTPHESKWSSHRDPLQIDVAPTLAILMGLPIPNNNLGQVLIGALDGYTDEEKLDVLYINSQQILRLMEENVAGYKSEVPYEMYIGAVHLHEEYISASSDSKPDVLVILHSYETAIGAMATRISASLTTYDLYSMTVAIVILFLCLLVGASHIVQTRKVNNIAVLWTTTSASVLLFVTVFSHVTACTSQSYYSALLCGWSLTSVAVQLTVFMFLQVLCGVIWHSCQDVYISFKWPSKGPGFSLHWLLVIGTLFHSVSFASSSFVEEEHQTWYFLVVTFNIVAMVTQVRSHIERGILKKDDEKQYDSSSNAKTNKYKYETNMYNQISNKDQNGDIEPQVRYSLRSKGINKSAVVQTKDKTKSSCDLFPSKLLSISKLTIFELQWRSWLPWRQMIGITMVLLLGRCLRSINQTGNKWLDTPDVGDWLMRPENKEIMSLLVPVSLLCILGTRGQRFTIETVLLAAGLTGCYGYRIATKTLNSVLKMTEESQSESRGITEARFVFLTILLLNMVTVARWAHYKYAASPSPSQDRANLRIKTIENLQISWIVLMTLLLRTHNTILVAMVVVQEQLLWRYMISVTSLPVKYTALLCWWMGQAVFFQQGNSNSISTVDVSAGYVGLQDYQVQFVGLLLYCATYAGPVFWLMSLVKYTIIQAQTYSKDDTELRKRLREGFVSCVLTLSVERVFTVCLYCIVVATQRYHLFVWTVFSPKLLYEACLAAAYAVFSIILLSIA